MIVATSFVLYIPSAADEAMIELADGSLSLQRAGGSSALSQIYGKKASSEPCSRNMLTASATASNGHGVHDYPYAMATCPLHLKHTPLQLRCTRPTRVREGVIRVHWNELARTVERHALHGAAEAQGMLWTSIKETAFEKDQALTSLFRIASG